MKSKNCVYSSVCTAQDCSEHCIRYLEMQYLLEHSNIPKNRWIPDKLVPDSVDFHSFYVLADIKSDIANFVTNGENLYIHSPTTGNGKTTWAIKLLLKYFDCIWAGNGFRTRGVFVNVPTFLTQIKKFEKKYAQETYSLVDDIISADLVVWDDIASTHLSQYEYGQLLSYIDQRSVNNLANIYTGNLTQEKMKEAIGERLTSRIWNSSTRIELRGTDKR